MADYLVIENNTVVNVIVADSAEIAAEVTGKEVQESTEPTPWIGWTKQGDTWVAPEPEPEVIEEPVE